MNMKGILKIKMVAGEMSGDYLAAKLLTQLANSSGKSVLADGIGGEQMESVGFGATWNASELAVNGYWDVLRRLPTILSIRRSIIQQLSDQPIDAFVGIDAPDFNLDVEAAAKSRNIPAIHFVSPSIWAWRAKKIQKIRRCVDHMLCLFPFEPEIYRNAGVPATFTGHPLADQIPLHPDPLRARRSLGLSESGLKIAILPGSRMSEVRHLTKIFLSAINLLNDRESGIQFMVPAANNFARSYIESLLPHYPDLNIVIFDGCSHTVIEASDVVLLASGTATLEAALYKKPMVISYKVPKLTAQMVKWKGGNMTYVGLPNILADKCVVPEFLQSNASPSLIAEALLGQLNRSDIFALVDTFTDIHYSLKNNAAAVAADTICEITEDRRVKAGA